MNQKQQQPQQNKHTTTEHSRRLMLLAVYVASFLGYSELIEVTAGSSKFVYNFVILTFLFLQPKKNSLFVLFTIEISNVFH